MTASTDRYLAYSDGELADIWNVDGYAGGERDALVAELRRRGYAPIDEHGVELHVAVPAARYGFVPPAPSDEHADRFTVRLSRTPDADGEYRAAVYTIPEDDHVRTFYNADREELRRRVGCYIEALRAPKLPDEVYEV